MPATVVAARGIRAVISTPVRGSKHRLGVCQINESACADYENLMNGPWNPSALRSNASC